MKASVGLLAALVASVVLVAPASAAAPRYILVTGPRLTAPVLFDDWQENLDFMILVARAPRIHVSERALAYRPRYDIAMFWGWTDAERPTSPTQANQHGWFYPAYGKLRPVIDQMADGIRVQRRAGPALLQIFARHGVPTRL